MKPLTLKSFAVILTLSVTWTTGAQMQAEASLIPPQQVSASASINRTADLAVIQKTLESKILRQKLHSLGLSDKEIQSRLDRLSDREIHQLASQIRAVNPAGDAIVYILVVVLLVLLIIYLIKRV
jgi:hypothetical protein